MKKVVNTIEELSSEIIHQCSMMQMLHGKGDRKLKISEESYRDLIEHIMGEACKVIHMDLPEYGFTKSENHTLQIMEYKMDVIFDNNIEYLAFEVS